VLVARSLGLALQMLSMLDTERTLRDESERQARERDTMLAASPSGTSCSTTSVRSSVRSPSELRSVRCSRRSAKRCTRCWATRSSAFGCSIPTIRHT
jgi:hypothetical protein